MSIQYQAKIIDNVRTERTLNNGDIIQGCRSSRVVVQKANGKLVTVQANQIQGIEVIDKKKKFQLFRFWALVRNMWTVLDTLNNMEIFKELVADEQHGKKLLENILDQVELSIDDPEIAKRPPADSINPDEKRTNSHKKTIRFDIDFILNHADPEKKAGRNFLFPTDWSTDWPYLVDWPFEQLWKAQRSSAGSTPSQ